MSRESQIPIIYSIFNTMKLYRFILPYLIVLFMANASFADDAPKMENAAVNSNGSGLALIPWDLFIGGMNSFTVGADWIFGDYNILYASTSRVKEIPKHSWVWTLRTQALWAPKFGVYLQPTIQYMFFDGFLAMCKISVGPEIGYKRKTGFEYGGSVRVGAFIDLLNFEMGYLVNSKRTYMNIILNLPSGLGIWV